MDRLEDYKSLIRTFDAEVICLQEIYPEDLYYRALEDTSIVNGPQDNISTRLAKELGYHHVQSTVLLGQAILTKHRIVRVLSNQMSTLAVELENGS